jgi:YebC/PmpR family DNA-binding regulatory protein
MAGHSAYSNIVHRKNRQDAKRAKIFTKLGREITVAAKLGGGNPDFNPRLRVALVEARKNSMPNDKIKKAIDNAIGGGDTANYEETRYEGFGPAGVSIIVDCLTDNRTRTANDIRMIFNKRGGNMGESGSVSYLFDRVGVVVYPRAKAGDEAMFDAAVAAGADDVQSGLAQPFLGLVDDEGAPLDVHAIYCPVEQWAAVRDALALSLGDADKAALVWRPNVTLSPDDNGTATTLAELIEALEDHDDVQVVTTNAG